MGIYAIAGHSRPVATDNKKELPHRKVKIAYHNTSFEIAGRIEGRASRLARGLGDHAIRLLGI